MMDLDPAQRMRAAAERTHQNAQNFAHILLRVAEALERSATLADEHAQRNRQAGHPAGAVDEQNAAKRAREAAQRARSRAHSLARRDS